jgi:hypothetical protein
MNKKLMNEKKIDIIKKKKGGFVKNKSSDCFQTISTDEVDKTRFNLRNKKKNNKTNEISSSTIEFKKLIMKMQSNQFNHNRKQKQR